MSPLTTDALIDAVNEEKKIVITDTSISVSTIAAAVADGAARVPHGVVACHLPGEAPRPSAPGSRWPPVIGPAMRGPTITTPMNRRVMPSRIEVPVLPLAPEPTPNARRATRKMPPMIQRTGERFPVSSATSRMAAMGSTREARHDGRNADTIVTTRPTTSETMTVRGATTGTVDGRSRPIAFSAAMSRNARPMPAEAGRRASRPRR